MNSKKVVTATLGGLILMGSFAGCSGPKATSGPTNSPTPDTVTQQVETPTSTPSVAERDYAADVYGLVGNVLDTPSFEPPARLSSAAFLGCAYIAGELQKFERITGGLSDPVGTEGYTEAQFAAARSVMIEADSMIASAGVVPETQSVFFGLRLLDARNTIDADGPTLKDYAVASYCGFAPKR